MIEYKIFFQLKLLGDIPEMSFFSVKCSHNRKLFFFKYILEIDNYRIFKIFIFYIMTYLKKNNYFLKEV